MITALFPAVLLTAALVLPDLAIHTFFSIQKTQAVPDESSDIIVKDEFPEGKSINEIQYEEFLLKEQAILEEINQLKENTESENAREEELRLVRLEEELQKIKVSKQVLKARMEEEKTQ